MRGQNGLEMRTLAILVVAGLNAVAAPGGSNFSWYQVDHPHPGVCVREPYGVIPNFDRPAAQAAIRTELAEMIQSGQRRLRIGIFHGHGFDTGTVMDSTGGDLSPDNRRNLAGLLAAAKAAGFIQVEIAFHPEGPAVREWTTWREDLYQENWSLIRRLRPLVRAAGIPYLIDLSNEAIPDVRQPIVLRYARTLWTDYTRAFGRADTVGFSVIGDPAHVNEIRAVYGDKPPYVFDIHFYGGTSGLNEYQQFRSANQLMLSRRLRQPWILGEVFYDDAGAAELLSRAIAGSSRAVWWLTQWPLTRASACADVDVGEPTTFAAYSQAGFATAAVLEPSVASRALRVDRHGYVAIRVRCDRSATPCSGTLALRVRRRTLPVRTYSVIPPRTTTLRVKLDHGRLWPRTGTVTLTARSLDSDSTARRSLFVSIHH